jgi:hypothetical protein
MQFVQNDQSLQGALVRTFIFHHPADDDADIIQRRIEEILAEQRDDGSFGDTSKETGERLLRLLELGLPPDRAEVARGVEALLRQKRAGQNADEWVEKEGALSIYALHALCLLGRSDVPEVQFSLNWYIGNPDEWNDPWKGCPWTPEVFWTALWAGRALADTAPTINDGLRRVAESTNAAGCCAYNDPYGFLDACGQIDTPQARTLLEKLIPLILRGQQPDGGWGDNSFFVFRALQPHGLLESLRKLPPLPPDWRTVRSIPAPAGDLSSLAWDGERLWTYDREQKAALALSPADGEVVRIVPLAFENVKGIGWWDGSLAVTQSDPKVLSQVNAETGETEREIVIDEGDWTWVGSVAQVNGKVWVVDEFSPGVIVINPAKPDDRDLRILAGPGPGSLAAAPDGVWHSDFWAHMLVETDPEGKLLEWGDLPFDVRGLAHDGQHLWALDGDSDRVCTIEKRPPPASGGPPLVLDGVVADFRRITNDLEQHQIVLDDATYIQPCVYLQMHLLEMWAAGWKDVDFDTLAAVSGASALFAYQPDEFMPKYANLHIGMDDRIAGATGFGYEWVDFDSFDAAWPIITESLDSGRPLKAWYWENLLIVGYEDAPQKEYRRVFVIADGPDTIAEWWSWPHFIREMTDWPHKVGRHTQRVEALPEKAVALRVMRDLVAWSAEHPEAIRREYPKATFGLAGIAAYAADCADPETYEDWTACHDINPQWTVRNSTARYLEHIAASEVFDRQATEHIAQAAKEYRSAYEAWCELYVQLGHSAPPNAGRIKERRLAGAAAVRKALGHEQAAIAEIEQVVAPSAARNEPPLTEEAQP